MALSGSQIRHLWDLGRRSSSRAARSAARQGCRLAHGQFGVIVVAGLLASLQPLLDTACADGPAPLPRASIDSLEVSTLHPRLLLRADEARVGRGTTVSEARARRLHPGLEPYGRLSGSDNNWEGILTDGLRAALLGDVQSRVNCVAWLRAQGAPSRRSTARQGGGHMAIAFDWLYTQMSAAERQQIAENLVRQAEAALDFLRTGEPDINHNFTYMALFTVAMTGLALDGEPGFETAAGRYLSAAREWLEGPGGVYAACQARGGGWPEGSQYSLTECTRLLVLTMHGFRSATNQDPFAQARRDHGDFARGMGRFYMALTRPDFTLERIGDVNRFKPLLRDQHRFVIEALADGLRFDGGEPETAAMLETFSDAIHAHYGWRDTHPNFRWGMVLFADPDAPRDAVAYHSQPLAQVFGRGSLDFVVIRHGWDENGTHITFQVGDHFVDHQHFDKGAFTLYNHGGLAIDSGAYDRMYSAHHRQYATRTIAHNAPLVLDPNRVQPVDYTADGGQQVLRGFQHHARWSDYLLHRDDEGLNAADLVRFTWGRAPTLQTRARAQAIAGGEDTSPTPTPHFTAFVVAQAELGGAYGGDTRSLRRTLAYWPDPQILVIHDAFDLAKPLEVRWLLHSEESPRATGANTFQPGATQLGSVDWWLFRRRGGIDLGERKVKYDGRLFLCTLRPGGHVARVVGGKGFEWSVGGRNPSPGSAGLEPREAGDWRLEVTPTEPAAQQDMTHVLQIADPSLFQMAACTALQARAGWLGAHVASAPEVVLWVARADNTPPPAYDVESALPSVHVLVGLPRDRDYRVAAADHVLDVRTDAEGVVAFLDPVIGPHRIEITTAR